MGSGSPAGSLTIRAATEDDVDAMCRVGHAAWPPTYAFAGAEYVDQGLRTWWSAEFVRASLVTTRYLVAEIDGRVVGVGNIDFRVSPPVIWKLYVLPEHQAGGVGSALLEGLLALVPAEEPVVTLEHTEGNERAARFFARHRFVEVRRDASAEPLWPATVWMEHTAH